MTHTLSVKLITSKNLPKGFIIKEFLFRNLISFENFEFESDQEASDLVLEYVLQPSEFPVLIFSTGIILKNPDCFQVAEAIGLHQKPEMEIYDLAIMGSGPAGLTAAIYAGSEGLKTVVIERHSPGGRAGSTSLIENLIAHPDGITGAEFSRRSRQQAEKFGVEFVVPVELNGIERENGLLKLSLSSGVTFYTHSLIIAVGVRYRMLDVPGSDKFVGNGIFYGAAMTEGKRCEGKEVYIVGGANSAGQAAMYFSKFAKKVHLIVRADSISKRMSHYLVKEIHETENIQVMPNSEILQINGNSCFESIDIKNLKTLEIQTFAADNLFLLIGGEPYTACMAGKFLRDANGFMLTGYDMLEHEDYNLSWKLERKPFPLETNLPGVFAIGDVRAGTAKRMAAAIGDGANAVTQVADYFTSLKQDKFPENL